MVSTWMNIFFDFTAGSGVSIGGLGLVERTTFLA